MVERVGEAIGGERDRAVLLGSSLGALTMARVAEVDARVSALVLLAPAFRIVPRWRARLGPDWETWRSSGWLEVDDYTTGAKARVDFGFIEELERIEPATLPDLRVPTLVLQGARDDVVEPAHARELAQQGPHIRLVELDDGHELTQSIPKIIHEIERFTAIWRGAS